MQVCLVSRTHLPYNCTRYHTYTHIHSHTDIQTLTHTNTHTYKHTHTLTHRHTHTPTDTHTHTHTHTYIYTYKHTHNVTHRLTHARYRTTHIYMYIHIPIVQPGVTGSLLCGPGSVMASNGSMIPTEDPTVPLLRENVYSWYLAVSITLYYISGLHLDFFKGGGLIDDN